jgi:hypothetical protein
VRRAAALLLACASRAAAAEWTPLMRLDVLGGQFFYEGSNTSFSGNANLLFSPGVRLSDKDTIVPTLSSSYRRTREVRELVGGGFLTQESLANTAMVKYVRQLNDTWAVKPSVSYHNELITESEDDELGDGLFDFHKVSAGLELERRTERLNVRHSVSAYTVRFYHYRALASSVAEDLGAEINSGDRVLDFDGYDYQLSADYLAGERTMLTGTALASYRPFRDQRIVTQTGEYVARNRYDFFYAGMGALQQRLPDWGTVKQGLGLAATYSQLAATQNNYDATFTRFNPDYYDYYELGAGPQWFGSAGQRLHWSLGYDFSRRRYLHRPVQTEDGSYSTTDDRVYTHTHTATWLFTYLLWKQLSLKVQGAYRLSRSNMTYEATYKYNYDSAHYFAGLSWSL